ncbi:MAG: DUF3822 family protein [Muribaculaceae bacterium]|nr:DUF3822 family protein [Muribaculaceae bacterium]
MTTTAFELENPSLWRLLLHVDERELTAAFVNTAEDSSLRVLRVSLPDGPTLVALEEAVYSHPVLLSDFRRVDVVLRSHSFSLLPGVMTGGDVEALAGALRPADGPEGDTDFFVDRIDAGSEGLQNVWTYPEASVLHFLARSFNSPKFHHHLSPLLKFYGRSSEQGNSGKLYVSMHTSVSGGERGEMDIVAFGHGGRLEMANSIAFESMDDATYYILASAEATGMNVTSDEIFLGGDSRLRSALQTPLRRFASYVLPQVFPAAALRMGASAQELPFPLIIIPICE